jgi:hypothetical protein
MLDAAKLVLLFSTLSEWEEREDHSTGPGLQVNQAWLTMFSDGSGDVVIELGVVPDGNLDDKTRRMLTSIGIVGCIEKSLRFETLDEGIEILQKPLVVEWDK